MHGHVQPVALGVDVRVGHRAGHGVPGLQPGPARLRPHGPGAGPGAHPGHRRDPAARRRRLPPVPAAHEARQPRRRLRVQRRPGVARAGRRGLPQGDRRPGDPRRARAVGQRRRARRRRSTTTCGGASTSRSSELGPHGLPLIGRADWNDCLNLNVFSDRPGESFQTAPNRPGGVAESVFIAGLFVLAAREAEAIARLRGDEARGGPLRRGGGGDDRVDRGVRLGRGLVPTGVRPRRERRWGRPRTRRARSSSSRRG